MDKGVMYHTCENSLATCLGLDDTSQIQINRRLDNGRSGAEVYLVDLPKSCRHTGLYFLKLDKRPLRSSNAETPFPCANIAASFQIDEYYCQITVPANFDIHDVKTWRSLNCGMDKLEKIFFQHLNASQVPRDFLGDVSVSPAEIIDRLLGYKLRQDKPLFAFLQNKFRRNPSSFSSYNFSGDVLPNAFAFAVDSRLWQGITLNNAKCPNHGDMHGENLMLSGCEGQHCLIDLESYTNQGWPFYDTAYFELAELLDKNILTPLGTWHDDIARLACKDFAGLDFAGSRMARHIYDVEEKWIQTVISVNFSQKTFLEDCRVLARVMVGLNFCGKRCISEAYREKAFLYASVFLRQMLSGNSAWQKNTVAWDCAPQNAGNHMEATRLAEWASNFDGSSAYILICGPGCCADAATGEALARIPWMLVVSFESNPDANKLFNAICQRTIPRKLYPGNRNANTMSDHANWLFAVGYSGEYVADNARDWNRRCYDYVATVIKDAVNDARLDAPLAIIDGNSMRDSPYLNDIIKICDRSGIEDIAFIADNNEAMDRIRTECDPEDTQHFSTRVEELASWCVNYMPDSAGSGIAIPCSQTPGILRLTDEQCASIQGNAVIICDALLDMEKDETDIFGFYYGQPVNWRAISAKAPVSREEINIYSDKIQSKEDDSPVRCINIIHKPGAGASIICRTLCWQFCHKFPTLEILQINSALGEGLRQIASLSGLPLLLLADGNFSASELDMLTGTLRMLHISATIIYTTRAYDKQSVNGFLGELTLLGELTSKDTRNFLTKYSAHLKGNAHYNPSEVERRLENLKMLSFNKTMSKLRLPFFYGMFAFEKDFESIDSYLDNVINNIGMNKEYLSLLKYVALVTNYASEIGIPVRAAAKIGGFDEERRQSLRKIMNHIYKNFGSLIINVRDCLRVAHPYLAQCIIDRFCTNDIEFSELSVEMLNDLVGVADGLPSSQIEDIAKCLFIDRNENNIEEKFSPIIIKINNFDCRKHIFETLIQLFPENAHFYHHFGRLLSYHAPEDISTALEYFDKAIELSPSDASCLHGRGNMYVRLIRKELENNYGIEEIYNRFHDLAEYAYNDFIRAMELVTSAKSAGHLSCKYPALSILELSAIILKALKDALRNSKYTEMFKLPVTPISKWAVEMQKRADAMEIEIANYHSNFFEDQFCVQMRSRLATLKFQTEMLESIINQIPHDISYKIAYLNSFTDNVPPSPLQLQNIIKWGEDIIRSGSAGPGLLWLWFKASLYGGSDFQRQRSIIESVFKKSENNIIAAFLLYAIYFAKFMGGDQIAAEPALRYKSIARDLANTQPERYSSRLFYAGNGELSLTKDKCVLVECRVKGEVEQRQSGTLYLSEDKRFSVFFVPSRWGMNIGQSFDKPLKCILGLSYGGLRAEN